MSPDTLETLRTALSDRYRVEHLLGSGGMATVYLAHDLKHDRPVAIKVLRPEIASALGPERFLREIQIAARLTHPHILPLHDSGEAGDLLYYVMPYIAGESLQDRIGREKQLPVDEAVRITREVASALAYAHAHDVVHRDIKPGNILMSDGSVLVADFGLARAISRAKSSDSITRSGLTIGTPAYMSPEQAAGEATLDGRSDIYALGCVLYELLAGDPPFTASNPSALIARHVGAAVVPIRTIRPAVPRALEHALQKALEKAPADRFQSAEQFAIDLGAEGIAVRDRTRPRRMLYGALAVAAATAAVTLWSTKPSMDGPLQVDTALYAVLPFARSERVPQGALLEQLVQDALARWGGVKVVARFQINDAMTRRRGTGVISSSEAVRVARQLGAGRYVRGDISTSGDSVLLRAGLFDATRSGGALQEQVVTLSGELAGADSIVSGMADKLILRGLEVNTPREERRRVSLPAVQAFARGLDQIQEWDLARADSAFTTALQHDQNYAAAALWLSQVRQWDGVSNARWEPSVERAVALISQLGARERTMTQALSAMSRGDRTVACEMYQDLTESEPAGFVGWFGLATCLGRDQVVVRDPSSPTRYRFRSSYHTAVQAYRRAFELMPSMHRALRSGSYASVRDVFFTSGNRLRQGQSQRPDTLIFLARPAWEADTLLFLPFPAHEVRQGKPGTMPASLQDALVHERQILHRVATAWVAAYPKSAEALEALAVALELMGDRSALDTLRRARVLAVEPTANARIAAAQAWMQFRFSLPDDLAGLQTAGVLAETLLVSPTAGRREVSAELVGLAALSGRVSLAAALSRRTSTMVTRGVPSVIATTAPVLLLYAAFGGPSDSILRLEREVEVGLNAGMIAPERERTRLEWLARSATLAFPEVHLESLLKLQSKGDELLDAQVAFLEGRPNAALAYFTEIARRRQGVAAGRLTFDALYPEAKLLLLLGDSTRALGWIDPSLEVLHQVEPQVLLDPQAAATLVRTMALRAELAQRAGDFVTARKWARVVATLWSGADDFLQSTVARLTRFVE